MTISQQFKDTGNVWLFIALGWAFLWISAVSEPGLKKTIFTGSSEFEGYAILAIVLGLMFLFGRLYFVKMQAKARAQKNNDQGPAKEKH